MPRTLGDGLEELELAAGRRRRDADCLLSGPGDPQGSCSELLVVPGPDGPAGFAVCGHRVIAADELDQIWGMAARFELAPRLRHPDTATMDALLAQWREHLSDLPEARAADTAAVVNWPARDGSGVPALLRHGLQPMLVMAARPRGRHTTGRAIPGLTVREARLAEGDAVTAMYLDLVSFDAQFGGAVPRPATKALVREDVMATLARRPSWTWLAERGGRPVGLVMVQPPQHATWVAGMTRLSPVAYVLIGYVVPSERGSGAATMLIRHVHEVLDANAIAVTLLHYAQVNPRSGPFWSRMGYRPLWVRWEARPASALR